MKNTKDAVLKAENVCFWYDADKPPVLDNLSFTVHSKEAVVLMGPSGSGKSTLAYCVAGLYPEYAGERKGKIAAVDGEEIADFPPNRRAQYISMMFQNPDDQFCMDTVENEIAFALENIAYTGDFNKRIQELLCLVGLEGMEKKQITALSGGTKQKVALATALATRPRVLVLDEPFANIDPKAAHDIAGSLKGLLAELDLALLIVDHRLDYWAEMATRIMVLGKEGRWAAESLSVEELKQNRRLLQGLGLFGLTAEYGNTAVHSILPKVPCTKYAVKANGLFAGYGKEKVIKGIDLQICAKTITAIMGANGSGKSTLLWTIADLLKHTGTLERDKPVGMVFQNPGYQFLTLKVIDEVLYTLRIEYPDEEEKEQQDRAMKLLREFGLEEHAETSPYMLSQGQQRRLAVLSMLAGRQKLLLLDEPTYAQDKKGTLFIMDLLAARVEKEGLTAIFATHDPYLAKAYAHRILYMNDGHIVQRENGGLYDG